MKNVGRRETLVLKVITPQCKLYFFSQNEMA